MYQLPDKPKERNLDFLTGYHERLRQLFGCENAWNSLDACQEAESFIYEFKDILPDMDDDKECYFYLLGKLWACHDYLEGNVS